MDEINIFRTQELPIQWRYQTGSRTFIAFTDSQQKRKTSKYRRSENRKSLSKEQFPLDASLLHCSSQSQFNQTVKILHFTIPVSKWKLLNSVT
jgi:hypothetical protein